MAGAFGAAPVGPEPPSARTARTLVLIGIILQGVLTALGFVLIVALVFLLDLVVGPAGALAYGFLAYTLVGVLLVVAVYWTSYLPIVRGEYERARSPTLVWGIVVLIFFSLISGILYLVAYVKLGDARQELVARPTPWPGYGPTAYGVPVYDPHGRPPMSGSPMPVAHPVAGAAALPPPAPRPIGPPQAVPTCARCGQLGSYVPQYGRWFCYRDGIYL